MFLVLHQSQTWYSVFKMPILKVPDKLFKQKFLKLFSLRKVIVDNLNWYSLNTLLSFPQNVIHK